MLSIAKSLLSQRRMPLLYFFFFNVGECISSDNKSSRIEHDLYQNNKIINTTLLDCKMREFAFEYATQIINNNEQEENMLKEIHDALRLKDLCRYDYDISTKEEEEEEEEIPFFSTESNSFKPIVDGLNCSIDSPCIFLQGREENEEEHPVKVDAKTVATKKNTNRDHHYFYFSIHEALHQARCLRREKGIDDVFPKIFLRRGIHSLGGRTLNLTEEDSGLLITVFPGEKAWISGGLALGSNIDFQEINDDGIFAANLTDILIGYTLPKIVSLFTSPPSSISSSSSMNVENRFHRRYIRARYPNADPETNQWGYATPQNLKFSLSPELVLEWHRPVQGKMPNFIFFDFRNNPPSGIPQKNDSTQLGYNWFGSGKGGVCADVWGPDANSYWCSNASQGGWAEVDRECAMNGQMQLPVGMMYNSSSSKLARFENSSLKGGFLHAWHSQSWSMHMFEIIDQSSGKMEFAKGGGRQGGRNWCRCDQCTYAGPWCGQNQQPPWYDTRLISGTWMVENIKDELDQGGEYYFDHESKVLFVKPNSTEDLVNFRIGMLERLVGMVDGASNITIQNVGFRDMAPTYMSDWSAPSGGDWSLHRGGALFLENVSNITIRDCIFRRIDGNALFLSGRTNNIKIESNIFEWIGENAIATWGSTEDYDATAGNFPTNTLIQYNIMREIGIYQKQSSAVGQCKAALTTIRKNIMFNMPRAALNFNDMLGGGDVVEDNLIFNTCRESGDHGPINTWDRQPFLTILRDGITKSFKPLPRQIRYNFIFANYGASQGVDNDDGSSWYHIHHNFFYSAEGFKMDYGGHDSVFEDNLVMAYPYDGQNCFSMSSFFKGHGHILRRNRCLIGLGHKMGSGCGDPSCASTKADDENSLKLIGNIWDKCMDTDLHSSSNEYYTPSGEALIHCGNEGNDYSLLQVQEKFGLETGSFVEKLPSEDTMLNWAKSVISKQLEIDYTSEFVQRIA